MCQVSTVSKLVPVKAQPGENCTSLRVVPVGNQAGMTTTHHRALSPGMRSTELVVLSVHPEAVFVVLKLLE